MRSLRFLLAIFVLALAATSTQAVDYKIDPTFSPSVDGGVNDIVVLPDGKVLAGGKFWTTIGVTYYYLVRLNADGTRDTSFNSPLNFPTDQEHPAGVGHIKPLANGQFLITGYFRVGSQNTSYARINADGSVDATMAFASVNGDVEPLPDGKFIACGPRVIGGQTYEIAHRLNSDGSPDPAFRVTFGTGGCRDVKLSSNGKILIAGFSIYDHDGTTHLKPLHRLNLDGSLDSSFDAALPNGEARGLTEQPDGKLLVIGPGGVNRLNSDGSLDLTISACVGDSFLPLPNGDTLMTRCRKYPGSFLYNFARVRPDGTVDPTLDWIPIPGSTVAGFRSTGNGAYFIYGDIGSTAGNLPDVTRLIPDLAPRKASFDFDGDGRSDVGVFRPSNAVWYISQSDLGALFIQWGLTGDKLAAHDYDGDGKSEIGIFRDGSWHGYSLASGYQRANMGLAGDQPLIGTFYNAQTSGTSERWVLRGIRSGVPTWYVWPGPSLTPAPTTLPGELSTDRPVIGDFDGDSWDDPGYFRDGDWHSKLTSLGAMGTFHWGAAGDIPVAADYDGDRQTDYAVFRPSTGDWYINGSTAGFIAIHWGTNGDVPVPADYDGDGKTDIAIYRNGDWWQLQSATGTVNFVHWGQAGDQPIPAQSQ